MVPPNEYYRAIGCNITALLRHEANACKLSLTYASDYLAVVLGNSAMCILPHPVQLLQIPLATNDGNTCQILNSAHRI